MYARETKVIKITKIITLFSIFLIVSIGFISAVSVSSVKARTHTIVIDAGHGGIDGGVTGKSTGVIESDLNLIISKLLGEQLISAGFRVVYTRSNKNGLYSFNQENKKLQDLNNRVKIINNCSATLVVSIHANYFTSSVRRGAQVFFDKSKQEDKEFARIMQDKLNKDINFPQQNRDLPYLSAEKYLLEKSEIPIIIVETGFLSNTVDEKLLVTPSYQMKISSVILEGIANYIQYLEAL